MYGNVENRDYLEEILTFICTHNLHNIIHYDGFTDHMYDAFLAADCVCICSENEAFGRVTVEGMFAECIVIGANTGGTVEIIKDGVTGLLYQQGDPKDLGQKISFCLHNPDVVRKIAKRGREMAVGNFSDVSNAEKILAVYDWVLDGKCGKHHD